MADRSQLVGVVLLFLGWSWSSAHGQSKFKIAIHKLALIHDYHYAVIVVRLSGGTIEIGEFSSFACEAEVPGGTVDTVRVQIRGPVGDILIEDNNRLPNGFFSTTFFIISAQASDSGQYLCTVFLDGSEFNTETFGIDFAGISY